MSETFTSFADQVLRHARETPQRVAVVCDGQGSTYADLARRALSTAAQLQAQGLEPGGARRIGLIASNSVDFVTVVVGSHLAGVTVVPLPGLITSDALSRMIDDSGVALLFHDLEHAAKAQAAVDGSSAAGISTIAIGDADGFEGSGVLLDRWLVAQPDDYVPVTVDPEWSADFIYSSGTTGTPKGIVQSYRVRSSYSKSLASVGMEDGSGLLQTVGLYSNFGMAALLLALWWGGTLFIQRKFLAPAIVDWLAGDRLDMAWFAPATLIRTVEAKGFEAAVRGKSCVKLCAGAPLSQAQKDKVIATWAGGFWDLYGQTETGTLTLLPMHAVPAAKWGSVGKALPTVELHIIDEQDKVLPPNGEGEIVARSTTMMTGYHQRDDANAALYWNDPSGGAFARTGDIGRIDSDGYLWLCDRKKDMIISGGYNIYPADIEGVLQGHPAIFEAAAVGCPSEKWGESPVAFVALRDGREAEEGDLLGWANARLGSFQRLAALKIISSLPQGTMGKTLKRELRDEAAREFGRLP